MSKYSLYKHVNITSGNVHPEYIYNGNPIIRDYMDSAWNDNQHNAEMWSREDNKIAQMMGYETYKYIGEI